MVNHIGLGYYLDYTLCFLNTIRHFKKQNDSKEFQMQIFILVFVSECYTFGFG